MINFPFEIEENSLLKSINDYNKESKSFILYTPSGERIYINREEVETINDNENFNNKNISFYGKNNIINENDFEKGIYNFQYYNFERNDNDNLRSTIYNIEQNENLEINNGSNNNENIEKSETKIKYKEMTFLITKEIRKKKNLFKTVRKRGKRRPKNGTENKPKKFNIKLKLKGMIIDSIFNYVNEKSPNKFRKLNFSIKYIDYTKLKSVKLKEIFENVSRKNNKDLNYNKKIIAKIYKEEDSELKKILELNLFDVYCNILNKGTNILLTGLKKKYDDLKQKTLGKKIQNYVDIFENISNKCVEYLNK